jgi:hypothetical protein
MRHILPILLFCFSTAYSQSNCDSYSKYYIPDDLNEALTYLDCKWTEKDKEEFRNQPEEQAVTSMHFGTGLSIRNGWDLWKGKNYLVQYFYTIGIFHPDDMSSIILTSFHRQLNKKDIDLDGQVKHYKDYWYKSKNEQLAKDKEQKKKSEIEFKTFKMGDSVKIAYKLSASNGPVFAHRIQKYPDLNEQPNCFVKGIVKGKKVKKRKYYLLTILVTDICGYKEAYRFKGKIIVGQEYQFNIGSYKVYHE